MAEGGFIKASNDLGGVIIAFNYIKAIDVDPESKKSVVHLTDGSYFHVNQNIDDIWEMMREHFNKKGLNFFD